MALDPTDPEVLAFVTDRHLATLTTLRADGSPHVVAVGFSYDATAGVARVITFAASVKARNAARGGRAAVCQVDRGRWLTMEGPVRLVTDPDGVAAAVAGYTARYQAPVERPDRVAIEITVERVLGSGVMRVLVASGPGAGHALPLMPFVAALADRGDDVLLVVPPELEATAQATGQPYRLGARPPADVLDPLWARFGEAPPAEAAMIANREIFGRLNTAAMLPALHDAVASWRPDAVLREPCEYASAITALRADIPRLQVGISQAAIEASATQLVAPALTPYGDDVVPALLAAPYLTRFPALLDPSPYAETWRYREPPPAPSDPLPDWWPGRNGPLVYVTFGSVAGSLPVVRSVFGAALAAVGDLDARVLVTVGRDVDIAALGPVAANTHVEAWVPQQDVLADAALVVCHGGSGTTFGALAAGMPAGVRADVRRPAPERRTRRRARRRRDRGPIDRCRWRHGRARRGDVPRLRAAIETVLADRPTRRPRRPSPPTWPPRRRSPALLDRLATLVS